MGRRRKSFGFKGINGKAIKLIVTEQLSSNKTMDRNAPKRLTKAVVAMMNRAGRAARDKAKNPNWTPKLSGALIASIRWENATVSARGNIVRGKLAAETPYARRQEFEHKTKRFYLFRAINKVAQPALVAELRKKKIYQEAFIGGISFG